MKGFFVLIGTSIVVSSVAMAATDKPLVLGHRGSSGARPEHTMASYELAIEQGADFIEPDLVPTKDGVLIARHENEISGTTDAAEKFPDRKKTKTIDGVEVTGWFTEDFTLAEIKSLKAKERLKTRDQSHNGKYEVPTFAEVLALAKKAKVGVYPETKHPSYFKTIGLPLEDALVKELKKAGMDGANHKVFIQSFELTNLKELKKKTKTKLIYLLDEAGTVPADFAMGEDKRTYGDMLKPQNLKELAKTVYGIGPYKRHIVPELANGDLGEPTSVVKDAHAAGLKVHPFTFRSDREYLHKSYNGDPGMEYKQFFDLGVDGVFSDFPGHAVKARDEWVKAKSAKK